MTSSGYLIQKGKIVSSDAPWFVMVHLVFFLGNTYFSALKICCVRNTLYG